MPSNVYPDATIDELAGLLTPGVVRHLEQLARARICRWFWASRNPRNSPRFP